MDTPSEIRAEFPRRVREIENAWIPMPDGVRLAARIWLPEDADSDPVPAILEYLPYRKRDDTAARDQLTHPWFAGHGYAGVRVDMRGTGDSDGVCEGEYLRQEQDDAIAVIEWLAAQPWCSGQVGMMGISWGGFNGLQVAARRPPALAAVITLCSTDDRYGDDIHFMGGAMLTDNLSWGATAFAIAHTPPDPEIVGSRWREIWKRRLEGNGLWLLDWFRHQHRDEFYAHGSICENYADIEIPVYAVGGWADGYTNAIPRMMENLTCPRKALIGPWAHKYPHFATPEPRIGFLQEALRWWDAHLKGASNGIMEEPMMRAWMQEPAAPDPQPAQRPGRWISALCWPPPDAKSLRLHLADAGLFREAQPAASPLLLASPETAGCAAPAWCAYGIGADGALDQNREAGLMRFFESEPLTEDMELFGFPLLRVRVSSATEQANLAATLSMVAPDGAATLAGFGILNLTHRNGSAAPQPMPLDRPVDATLQLNAIGQRIPAGWRLRLALSSAYWPMIWPSAERAALTLHLSDSWLDLPLHIAADNAPTLPPFPAPQSAPPLEAEQMSPAKHTRAHTIDSVSGEERHRRSSDSGRVRHLHTGLETRHVCKETFRIHPADPNSARAVCRWRKTYARGDWKAEVKVKTSVAAHADVWRIRARLTARDQDGVVATKIWSNDIPRPLAGEATVSPTAAEAVALQSK